LLLLDKDSHVKAAAGLHGACLEHCVTLKKDPASRLEVADALHRAVLDDISSEKSSRLAFDPSVDSDIVVVLISDDLRYLSP
jgi:hypothetical protein